MFFRFRYHIIGFLFLSAILTGLALNDLEKSGQLGVYFYDVGEGDAILLETPDRDQILIDGGPTAQVVQKLGRDLPFYDREIELLISTHPDSDHLRGLIEVMKRYKVDMILVSDIKCDTAICQERDKLIKEGGITVVKAFPGQAIGLGADSAIKVLSSAPADHPATDNAGSLVLRLDYGRDSFLFTGDIEKDTEENLAAAGVNLSAEVLKVAHHGSKTSSAEDFLAKVKPAVSVISVGKNNSYGHPAAEVLARLESLGSRIMRTDELGDIRIFSDGNGLLPEK